MLVVVVIPGYQFDGCDFGVDELNRAANPTVQIQGLVGSSEISDGAVTRCKLGISAFFWAAATGGPEAYLGAPCDGVNATNLVDGVWAIWKVPVDCAAGATFKLGDTAAKNILVNRKLVGARYLKKDQLVCSQYNATLDGWEVHNIQQPVAPYAEPASLVHRGAPGPLPPAPAGTERVWTSRRGWVQASEVFKPVEVIESPVLSQLTKLRFESPHKLNQVPSLVAVSYKCILGDSGYLPGDELSLDNVSFVNNDISLASGQLYYNKDVVGVWAGYDSSVGGALRIYPKTDIFTSPVYMNYNNWTYKITIFR